jgi:hypothetical protein
VGTEAKNGSENNEVKNKHEEEEPTCVSKDQDHQTKPENDSPKSNGSTGERIMLPISTYEDAFFHRVGSLEPMIQWYKAFQERPRSLLACDVLNIPYGNDNRLPSKDEITKSFRHLSRFYHPDTIHSRRPGVSEEYAHYRFLSCTNARKHLLRVIEFREEQSKKKDNTRKNLASFLFKD